MEEKTFLGFQNRQFGIPLLNNGPQRLADLIGLSKAIEFLLLDRLIGAREAVELGIANSVVQDGTGIFQCILKNRNHLPIIGISILNCD